MPSVDENVERWNEGYDWRLAGDPWSKPWGGPDAQWDGCLYPRVGRFLPARAVLRSPRASDGGPTTCSTTARP